MILLPLNFGDFEKIRDRLSGIIGEGVPVRHVPFYFETENEYYFYYIYDGITYYSVVIRDEISEKETLDVRRLAMKLEQKPFIPIEAKLRLSLG